MQSLKMAASCSKNSIKLDEFSLSTGNLVIDESASDSEDEIDIIGFMDDTDNKPIDLSWSSKNQSNNGIWRPFESTTKENESKRQCNFSDSESDEFVNIEDKSVAHRLLHFGEHRESKPTKDVPNSQNTSDLPVQAVKAPMYDEVHEIVQCNLGQSNSTKLKKLLICRLCKKSFSCKNNLFHHLKSNHINSADFKAPFQCEECEQKFMWKAHLLKHKFRYTKGKTTTCKRARSGPVKHKCQLCNTSFSNDLFETHESTYASCSKGCGKVFCRQRKLKLHEKSCNQSSK